MTSNTLRLIVADRLRQLMDSTPGLGSQARVGAASGVAQSTVGRILKGDVSATLDNVEAIAQAFDVSPVAMLTRGNEADGSLATLFALVRDMPHAELGKVLDFARWVKAQTHFPVNKKMQHGELNIERESTAVADAERGAIQRGARASAVRTLELDEDAKQSKSNQGRRGRRRPRQG